MKTTENKGFLTSPNAMGRSVAVKLPVAFQKANKINGFEHIFYGTALNKFIHPQTCIGRVHKKTGLSSFTLALVAGLLAIAISKVPAGTVTWSSGANPYWNVPATWAGGVVPTAGDDVFLNLGSTMSITNAAAASPTPAIITWTTAHCKRTESAAAMPTAITLPFRVGIRREIYFLTTAKSNPIIRRFICKTNRALRTGQTARPLQRTCN